MIPQRIYLSGGGVCAIAHVGALKELSKQVPINAIKEWMGVSAGALVAMCLAIGFTLDQLHDLCMRFDFTNITEYDSIPGWLLHFGIDTGERLHKLIEACLHGKGLSSDSTFAECYNKHNRSLRVVVTDLNAGTVKVFSPLDTPNYKVADAVRASMSFPYYFQPFIDPETGHYFADGGVVSNYPLFILSKEEQQKTLSILIHTGTKEEENMEIESFVSRPIRIMINQRGIIESKLYHSRCIHIDIANFNILEFSLNEETKNMLFDKGMTSVKDYIKSRPKPVRRYSVS